MSEEGPVVGPGFEAMKPLLNEAGNRRRMGQDMTEIPLPPLEMRQLVGPTDPALFDNPSGEPIFPNLPVSAYDAVFDFGCGCGRIARQLLQQQPRPSRYVGVDIHRGMIEWCQNNLSAVDSNFVFYHHDVFNLGHAPDNTRQRTAPFEVEDSAFSLVLAWSVFTHIYEQQTLYYLNEIARIMRLDGRFISTWFLFDKREFPMMQDFQNTLFINETDPTNAVIYDREWLRQAVAASGLAIVDVEAPGVRGYAWRVTMKHQKPGGRFVEFPPDTAPYGSIPPPLLPPQGNGNGSSEDSPAGETHEDQGLAQNSDPSERPTASEMSEDKNEMVNSVYLGHPFVYPPDSLIGEFVARGKAWDAVLGKILSGLLTEEQPTICEVGSNIGASLLQMLSVKPRARVLAFEPSDRFRPFLERNLELAGYGHVEVSPLLVGNRSGSVWLYNNASTASAVSADYDDHEPRGKQLAETTTLDEVFRDRDRVDFIKIDTDGFEFEVLRGGEATLRRDLPILHFEIATYLVSEPAANLAWLQSLGYRRLVCLEPEGGLIGTTEDAEQAVFWADENGYCDVLVCHEHSPSATRLKHLKLG